jgi:hypothetical protein
VPGLSNTPSWTRPPSISPSRTDGPAHTLNMPKTLALDDQTSTSMPPTHMAATYSSAPSGLEPRHVMMYPIHQSILSLYCAHLPVLSSAPPSTNSEYLIRGSCHATRISKFRLIPLPDPVPVPQRRANALTVDLDQPAQYDEALLSSPNHTYMAPSMPRISPSSSYISHACVCTQC